MDIDFDASKNEKNVRERNLPFERVGDFDFGMAIVRQDVRKAYPEPRFVALGMLDDRLHALCFTPTAWGHPCHQFSQSVPKRCERRL